MFTPSYKILPTDRLLRRVTPPPYAANALELVKILQGGKKEITRLAFRPHPVKDKDGLSVSIVELAKSLNLLYNNITHLAVIITSKQCTDIGLTTEHNPLSDKSADPLFAHALIKGLDNRKDLQATLAEKCKIIA